jgi:hypothetical protein
MVRMQIHLLPEAHSALQKCAHEAGVSASELVRQGIELRLRPGAGVIPGGVSGGAGAANAERAAPAAAATGSAGHG